MHALQAQHAGPFELHLDTVHSPKDRKAPHLAQLAARVPASARSATAHPQPPRPSAAAAAAAALEPSLALLLEPLSAPL